MIPIIIVHVLARTCIAAQTTQLDSRLPPLILNIASNLNWRCCIWSARLKYPGRKILSCTRNRACPEFGAATPRESRDTKSSIIPNTLGLHLNTLHVLTPGLVFT